MSVGSAAPEPPRLRLWGGSAIAVLLAHLAITGLLLWHVHPYVPPPATPAGIDVDLTTLPAAAPVNAATPRRRILPQRSRRMPHPMAPPRPLQPLQPVQPVAAAKQQTTSPEPTQSAGQLANDASSQAASAAEAAESDLTTLTPAQGALADAAPAAAQIWYAQVHAQLRRYLRYPLEARRRRQQDTVQLELSVNRSGAVTDSRVDSTHHYRALEQEVLSMVRSAGPFPPPPAELHGDPVVMNFPVQFHLKNLTCPLPAAPGAAPSGVLATLAQMRAYRQRLIAYVAAAHSYEDCLDHLPAAPAPSGGRARQTPGAAYTVETTRQSRADHSQSQLPQTELSARRTVTNQMKGLVSGFETQAKLFVATAKQKAQQAQMAAQQAQMAAQQAAAARLAKAQAVAAQAYAACDRPAGPGPRLSAASDTMEGMRAYRKALAAYDTAVRSYVTCIHRAHAGTLVAAGNGLTAAQRSQLDRDAAQIENAAITSLNQHIAGFNAQLRHVPTRLPKHAGTLLAALTGTWSVPQMSSLPPKNCIRISYASGRYQATLCQSVVQTAQNGSTSGAVPSPLQGPLIAGGTTNVLPSGVLPDVNSSFSTAAPRRPAPAKSSSMAYAISNLLVQRDHVVLTISRVRQGSGRAAGADSPEEYDLTLSADNRRLSGTCIVKKITRPCHLDRR